MKLTGREIREARALIGLSRSDLAAKLSIIGTPSLKRIEMYDGPPPITQEHAAAIQRALEWAGVEFTADGVRLRSSPPTSTDET